jgi:hypothetical protein
MVALATIPLTCWICAWLAGPRTLRLDNDVAALVYSRLLGRHQRLTLLALLLTGGILLTLILSRPQRIDSNLQLVRGAHAECTAEMGKDHMDSGRDVTAAATVHCYEFEAGGKWVEEKYQRGIGWQTMASVAAPIDPEKTIHGSKP